MPVVHIRLNARMMEDINSVVADGYYSTKSEFIKSAVRRAIFEYNATKGKGPLELTLQ